MQEIHRAETAGRNDKKHMVLASMFTMLTAAGAFLKIPFYPVPFTMQTLATCLAGLILLPRWAFLSQVAYLVLGLVGLPVFAGGGGLGYILRPTFGYLALLPVASLMISMLYHRREYHSFLSTFAVSCAGLFLVLIGGGFWLYIHLNFIAAAEVTFAGAMTSGIILFIPATFLKALLASYFGRRLKKEKGL